LVLLARSDGAGVLLRSESADQGQTWSPWVSSGLENPGSKFRLFRLRDGRILLLHNPQAKATDASSEAWGVNRNPLALWVSEDDMQTWPHRRVIADFPGILSYPDGEVDKEEQFVHFAFDYNRHDVIYWKVAIPGK
jgi:predicted neuraminidase